MWQAIFSKSFDLWTKSIVFHLQYDRKFNQPFVNLHQNDSWKSFSVVGLESFELSMLYVTKTKRKSICPIKKRGSTIKISDTSLSFVSQIYHVINFIPNQNKFYQIPCPCVFSQSVCAFVNICRYCIYACVGGKVP